MEKEKGYKIIEDNGRTYYQCDKCQGIGTNASVIEAGYCHKRTSGSHSGKKNIIKKLEQKNRVKGMSKISIKKFNDY